MNKILAFLLLALVGPSAQAGVSCSVPFNLQNGTTADATQVMANYNAIIACLGNAATAGANNDITSLTALSTPITPAQGGTNTYTGGASSGSGNAQVVASVTPSTGFSPSLGKRVVFRAAFSNSGATQVNVAGTGLIDLYRVTNVGVVPAVGGEILAGQVVEIVHDGTRYQLVNSADNTPVGTSIETRIPAIPLGYLYEDGACVSRTTYATLFALLGTTYGGCSPSDFNLPDSRGRVNLGYDNTNATLPALCNTTVIGARCGSQNHTLVQANLPNVTLDTAMYTSAVTVTDTRNFQVPTTNTGAVGGANGVVQSASTNNNVSATATSGSISAVLASDGLGHPGGAGLTTSINGNTTQLPVATAPPLMVTVRVIKY